MTKSKTIMSGYGRVSTDEEKQLDSLEHQKEFFADFAISRNYTLYNVYADEGISGKQLKKRDEFNRMMKDAELGLFTLVVVKDVSRFARNTVDLLTSVRKLKSLGVEVLFVNNNQKVLGESEFIITLLGAMAQEESSNLSKRVKFGKKINAKKGRVPPRIFGYDRIDNFTLSINEDEADIVREMFRLYVEEGLGCRRIALDLDAQGARTKFGYQWNSGNIKKMLENPIYCGRYINHKYEITDFLEGTRTKLPLEENFEHDRPDWAIISEDVFDQAQKIKAERRIQYQNDYTHTKGRYSSRHLFSTLIKCEHCGRSFSRRVVTYKNTYIYWRCTTNNQYTSERCDNNIVLEEGELKDHIYQILSDIMGDEGKFASTRMEKYETFHADKRNDYDVKALTSQKEKLEYQKERYQELFANDIISLAEVKQKIAKTNEQIETILKQISQGVVDEAKSEDAKKSISKSLRNINEFLALENATNVDLRKIISKIEVNRNGELKIHLKIDESLGISGF